MSGAFLCIDASVTGRRWVGPDIEHDRAAQQLTQLADIPEGLAQVLARLEVPLDNVSNYLAPSLRELMPDPDSLRDMKAAATRLVSAATAREKVAIFADYDVDGASSAALICDWLRSFGVVPTIYVPDRIDEGYGPNEPAMAKLAKAHDLVICVDCGTLSHDAISAAIGADVLVLDHHLGGETLPDALAVVNPNRQDETTDLTYLCAAGVVFMALVSANRILRETGQKTPDLMGLLDLVALATVADVAPLQGLNRAFVRQGLKIMGNRGRPGLVALCDIAGLNSAPSAYHLGFVLGPRINAGGRVGKADLGTRLLISQDPHEADAMATRLQEFNLERREIEANVQLQAVEQAEARGFDAPLVWAAGEGWHPGVVGIVASRLKEMSNRPSIVIGLDGDEGKGSGRSVTGIDLGAAIAQCARENHLLKGGGHKMAAGLTVAADKLEPAMARLAELLDKQGASALGPRDLRLDGMLHPRSVTTEMIEQIETAGPFGAGAPAPRYALSNMGVSFAKRAGEDHLRLTFSSAEGAKIDAIAFKAFQSPMGSVLENHKGQKFHIAGRLEIDDWGGRKRPKLRLEDIALA